MRARCPVALFSIVVSARISDIALSDGMTRGSINAVFQVLPVEERLAVQAAVEGVGVPVAIGATGVVLMVMNALDLGTSAIVVFALVLCTTWTVTAVIGYRDYRRALAERLRRRGLDVGAAVPVGDDERTAARRLVLTGDVRDVRLGLDLAVTANLSPTDLADLAEHEDRDIRLLALGQLARRGDADAATEAAAIARSLAASADDSERRRRRWRSPTCTRRIARTYSGDSWTTPTSPSASPRSTAWANRTRVSSTLVVDAVDDPAAAQVATDASRRLGRPALALAAARLAGPGSASPRLLRLLAAVDVTPSDAVEILEPLVAHRDRRISTGAIAALARHGASVDSPTLDRLLTEDVELSAAALAAATTMTDADHLVRRALDDLVEVLRDRVLAVLAVRHGEHRIVGARHALSSPDRARRALGVECCSSRSRGPKPRSSTRSSARTWRHLSVSGGCDAAPRWRNEIEPGGSPTSRSTRRAGGVRPGCRPSRSTPSCSPPRRSPLDTHANWPSPRNPRRRRLQRSPSWCSPQSARTAQGCEEGGR